MNDALPAWAIVLVAVCTALISGALGAVAATWWQTQHERREAWRSRLIDAATDFARHAVAALRAAEDALEPPHSPGALTRLAEAFDEMRTSAYQVDLLFGNESEPSKEAWTFVDAIDDIHISLERKPPEIADAKKLAMTAYSARHHFSKAAHDAIRELRLP